MNYFQWAEERALKLAGCVRPVVRDVVDFEPVDVSAMQGIVVGLPSVEEARMLMALFGAKR